MVALVSSVSVLRATSEARFLSMGLLISGVSQGRVRLCYQLLNSAPEWP